MSAPKPSRPRSRAQFIAAAAAEDACENNFPSRRGTYEVGTAKRTDYVVLYDNNPWANDPMLRPRQLAMLTQRLEAIGVPTLARASYPADGEEDAGYTEAMVFPGTVASRVNVEESVRRLWTEILDETLGSRTRAAGGVSP